MTQKFWKQNETVFAKQNEKSQLQNRSENASIFVRKYATSEPPFAASRYFSTFETFWTQGKCSNGLPVGLDGKSAIRRVSLVIFVIIRAFLGPLYNRDRNFVSSLAKTIRFPMPGFSRIVHHPDPKIRHDSDRITRMHGSWDFSQNRKSHENRKSDSRKSLRETNMISPISIIFGFSMMKMVHFFSIEITFLGWKYFLWREIPKVEKVAKMSDFQNGNVRPPSRHHGFWRNFVGRTEISRRFRKSKF